MMNKNNFPDKTLYDSFIYWKTQPSEKVKSAFGELFPKALNIKWRVLNTGLCKVIFSLNNEKLFAIFTSDGEFVRIYSE